MKTIILSVDEHSVVMLGVVMLGVVMLNVVAPSNGDRCQLQLVNLRSIS
jgi:hypothetical protein